MERSEIQGGIDASRQSRITLRSIRATAFHPPLQGEDRPPQAGGVGCSAPPLARAPVHAVTPPAALRASTSPSRGGGEISFSLRGRKASACGYFLVMAGLDPAIHVFVQSNKKDVDARHKAGHDEWRERSDAHLVMCLEITGK